MKRISFLALSLLFILFACNKNKNQITLSYSNIDGEVTTLGNLIFTFNQNIAPDSILYYWQDKEYLDFSPKIEGQYKWLSSNELSFSPKEPLKPATDYKASFTSEITKINSDYTSIEEREFIFNTAALDIQYADVFWYLKDDKTKGAKIELEFNYKVNASAIENNIIVEIDGKTQEIELLTSGESFYSSFTLPDIEANDDDLLIHLELKSGILAVGASNKTKVSLERELQLKSPFKIEISSVETDHDGVEGTLTIKTSQEVISKNIEDYITIKPKVKFTTEVLPNSILVISDQFDVNTKYELELKKGLQGLVGGKLQSDYESDITFGKLEPSIEFENSKGMYLSTLGNKNIAVRIINVPEVKVSVFKLYENNLLSENTGGDYYDDYYYEDYYYDDYYYNDVQTQDLIFEKVFTSSQMEKIGSASLLKLDFKDELKDFKGIYFIKVQSTEDYWLNDGKYITLSDIGLIAKAGQNKVYVFANSIKSAESLGGVNVKVFGRNNQLISESVTAADGSASMALKNSNFTGFKPALITAEKNGDFTMINLQDTRVETSRFEVGGYRDLPNGLQTFIYLERNLYRPGEEIHYAAIIRNQSWASPGSLPIRVEVLSPTGKTLNTYKKTLNDEGSLEGAFTVAASGLTGSYTIYLYTSNEVLLASKNVLVEEFMPDRIKVTTELDKKELTLNSSATDLSIYAQNLFGPPAANRNFEIEISYHRKYFSPKEYSDYNFHITNADSYLGVDVREGKTDDDGKAYETIKIPEGFKNMGAIQTDILTTVFDETGRPVNRKNTIDMFTQDIFYGIGDFPYYLSTNTSMKIPFVAVDKDGKAKSNVKAKVQIIKHEYQTVLNKSGSYFRYESNKIEKKIVDKSISLNGETIFDFAPLISGSYEVRVYNPNVNGKYVSQYFYAYGYGKTYLSSFEVDNEGRIDIEIDKTEYELGNSAKILFKTPFQGKLLVTVEGKDVLEHFYVNTDKRSAEISIEMIEAYLPNVYISATLFKPHEASEFPLTVAHGFQSISVKDNKREIPISINAVSESRSNTKQSIKVKGAPNSYISVAVVDEGILQVGGFSTPKPYAYFYQKRALQVNSFDVYPYLLPEISSSNSSGGDGGFDMSKRINPFQNKRVKLVSYWSGLLKTNSSGEATYEIDIPQFSGSLRVMAVGHKGYSFGSTDVNIIVADPIVISSSIPRFFSPGDTAYISTTLSNTTDKLASAKSTISVSGPLKVVGSSKENVSIANKKEERIVYKVYASNEIGIGKITITCSAFNETFKEETDITIRPAVPLLKTNEAGIVSSSKSVKLNLGQDKYMENSTDYKLVVSKNPMVEFADDLDYLVRYPYGCSEQTVSAVFPQLYYKDLIQSMYGAKDNSANVNQNIITAINKLKMRQLYNGAISTWDNCACESWWTSVYAAHFLLEAKKAGFSVDDDFLETILGYLKNKLKSKETITYYYSRTFTKRIAPKEVAYSLYVLALANKADISLMNYYKSNTILLANDSKYLLAAAYVLAGDKEKGKSILPNTFESDDANAQFGGSYYSATRDEAVALNALLDIDPNHKDIGLMVKHVSEKLRNKSYYLNTQERIFSLLALGKIAQKANQTSITASITASGKTLGTYSEGVLKYGTAELKNKEIEIKVNGNGNLYYFWEAEGISKDGSFKEEDSHLKVRKTFYDRYGKVITKKNFKQNELIVIELSIRGDYDGTVDNVVITDMLPAGFEIENPRIDDVPGTDWIKNKSYPDNTDIRDDRILFFDDIYTYNGNSQKYYYVVRAVSPGIYKMGPVGADAMYNGEYHSYNGGGWIKIVE